MLRELLAVLNSHDPLGEILDQVLARVTSLLDADAGAIYLMETEPGRPPFLRVGASLGLTADRVAARLTLDSAVSGLAAQRRRPTAVSNIGQAMAPSLDSPTLPMRVEDMGSHLQVHHMGGPGPPDVFERVRRLAATHPAALGVPLYARDETYGTLTLFYRAARDFTPEDIELATAFAAHAALAIQNARLREAAYQQTRESERRRAVAEGLAELMAVVNSGGDLDSLLKSTLALAARLFGSDAGAVYLANESRDVLERRATRGRSRRLPAQVPTGAAIGDALVLPLATREETFGALALVTRPRHRFGAEELHLAEAFAACVGLAIENVRLYERAQHAATLEERQRLARELHDAVTQTLFSASLVAEVLPALWAADPDKGRQHLEELRRLTRGAMAEMRTLLVELRPGALNELGLSDLLRQLGEATMGRADLEVSVVVTTAPPRLPTDTKLAVYRIAQEALNNVVKHARAHHARLELDAAWLRIVDDGRGFELSAIPPGHLGVGIMAERARAVGATFNIESSPDRGTAVSVAWPTLP